MPTNAETLIHLNLKRSEFTLTGKIHLEKDATQKNFQKAPKIKSLKKSNLERGNPVTLLNLRCDTLI